MQAYYLPTRCAVDLIKYTLLEITCTSSQDTTGFNVRLVSALFARTEQKETIKKTKRRDQKKTIQRASTASNNSSQHRNNTMRQRFPCANISLPYPSPPQIGQHTQCHLNPPSEDIHPPLTSPCPQGAETVNRGAKPVVAPGGRSLVCGR